MKKKEVFIVFVLAVLVTGLSFGYEHREPPGFCCGAWLEKNIKGFPSPFALTGPSANEGVTYFLALRLPGLQISLPGVVANIFFWFLVLAPGWFFLKLYRKKALWKKMRRIGRCGRDINLSEFVVEDREQGRR